MHVVRVAPGIAIAIPLVLAACSAGGSPSVSPSPSAAAMTVALAGEFHDVDDTASGTVQLARLRDGSYEVVFEDFSIAATTNLKVYLVKGDDVTASSDVQPDEAIDLGALKGTTGMQVYPFPADMNAAVMSYHTVVIWDAPMGHAIAAAPLGQP